MAPINKEITWLVLGSSGQLGMSLLDELKTKNARVFKFGHKDLDITSKSKLLDSVNRIMPEVIVNCAAWTDVEQAENHASKVFEINAYAAESIANACKKVNAKYIQLSTDYVFSGKYKTPILTDATREPISIYGKSKLMCEDLVLSAYSEGSYILRTSWLYSKHGSNFPKKLITKYLSGLTNIPVVCDQIGQPTLVNDLSQRIQVIVESNVKPGIYHVTNSGSTSWFDFAQRLFDSWGFDSKVLSKIKTNENRTLAQRPQYSVLDDSDWIKVGLPKLRSWESAADESAQGILDAWHMEAK